VIVNRLIRNNTILQEHRAMPISEAQKLGAMALFGEKYGDKVRVIQYGESVEFCGGTHVPATGQIGSCVILSESAISAGVRRIEATTGVNAEKHYYIQEDLVHSIKGLYNNTPNVLSAVERTLLEVAELKKRLEKANMEKAQGIKEKLLANASLVDGVRLVKHTEKDSGATELMKQLAFMVKTEKGDVVFAGGAMEDGKPSLVLGLSDSMVAKGLDAGKIIREAAKLIQGGGGGQAGYATAGGKNESGMASAIEQMLDQIFKK
jgi:alanyl-tRNA synthetase